MEGFAYPALRGLKGVGAADTPAGDRKQSFGRAKMSSKKNVPAKPMPGKGKKGC